LSLDRDKGISGGRAPTAEPESWCFGWRVVNWLAVAVTVTSESCLVKLQNLDMGTVVGWLDIEARGGAEKAPPTPAMPWIPLLLLQ